MIQNPPLPRYVQIRETLQQQIKSGDLQPGEKLPSEDDLALEYGVSRMTMRKSLDDLIEAGLIYRRHGVGTFVSKSIVQRDHTRLTDFFATCQRTGHDPHARLLRHELLPADSQKAEALGLPTGEQLLRLTTLRYVDDVPVTCHDAFLPVRYFPGLVAAGEAALAEALAGRHVWQVIEAEGYAVANVVERLEAQSADQELAGILQMQVGDPVLYGERVLYSDDGTALKYAECFNCGDRFSLTVVLAR